MQDLANTACQMMIGWRLQDDLQWLVGQAEGDLRIDLLSGETTHNGTPIDPLHISGELQAWLSDRVASEQVPLGYISTALMECTFTAVALQHRRRPIVNIDMHMRCQCRVEADGKTFVGEAAYR